MDAVSLNPAATTVAIGGLVLALTQSTKRWTPEGWGPVIAAVWTSLALVVWLVSQPDWPPARGVAFDLLSIWVAVYVSALGLYSAAMVPSSSRQSIGTGDGRAVDGNTPVGETAPTNAPARKVRRSRAKTPAVLTEPVVGLPAPRSRPRARPVPPVEPEVTAEAERVRVVPAGKG